MGCLYHHPLFVRGASGRGSLAVEGAGLLSLLSTSSKSIHFDETESESDPASRRQSLTRSSETPYYPRSSVFQIIDLLANIFLRSDVTERRYIL